jgi:hypothetical protein
MTEQAKVLDAISESLRSVNNIRDFLAAAEVGAKVASDMLNEVEQKLLDVMAHIGDEA